MTNRIAQFNFTVPLETTDNANCAYWLYQSHAETTYAGFTVSLVGDGSRMVQIVSVPAGCELLHVAEFLTELAYLGLLDDLLGFVFNTDIPGDDTAGVAVFEPSITAFSVTTVPELIDRMKNQTLILNWQYLLTKR